MYINLSNIYLYKKKNSCIFWLVGKFYLFQCIPNTRKYFLIDFQYCSQIVEIIFCKNIFYNFFFHINYFSQHKQGLIFTVLPKYTSIPTKEKIQLMILKIVMMKFQKKRRSYQGETFQSLRDVTFCLSRTFRGIIN